MEIKQIKKQWKHKGRKCVILWLGNHFCAYVESKLKDISYTQEFGDSKTSPEHNIDAHGGLTFSGELEIMNDKINYFGCDYAHSGDYMEGASDLINTDFEGNPSHKSTLKEVEKETNEMCESIIVYEKIHHKYKKAFDSFQKEIEEIRSKGV